MKVLETLKDPKVQKELEPLMEAFGKKDKLARRIITIFLIFVFGSGIGMNIYFFLEERNESTNYSMIN